jgi:hypothetical protein
MKIRFIKLGNGGGWEKSCIEKENTLRIGYESPFHQECLKGDWEPVREFWLQARNGNEGSATRDINQIRDFYELSETDIWITFYRRGMYWCHAHKEVTEEKDGSRIRKVIGTWSCTDKKNNPLTIENIDGRITKVQGFRGTICGVELPDYLIRKINGEAQPDMVSTEKALVELKDNIENLIKGLWWNDFELLVDLIFAKLGWQRISILGKTEKDVDLDVFSPVTQQRGYVQVKSSTSSSEITKCYEDFKQYQQYDEMYFVFHSFTGSFEKININDPKVYLWDLPRVSELVIRAGLIDWLITKRS